MSRLSFSRYHSPETPRAPTTRLLLYLTSKLLGLVFKLKQTFVVFQINHVCQINLQIKLFPLPLSRNAKACDHPASSAVSHKFYLLRLVLDRFPYKNKHLYHLHFHSRKTPRAATTRQILRLVLLQNQIKPCTYIDTSCISFWSKSKKKLVFQINLHFPN